MKPRLTWGWYDCFGFGVALGGWFCTGFGAQEFGVTPAHAFENWKAKQQAIGKVVLLGRRPRWWDVLRGVR